VYGREGTPLVLPIDADMADLRREARSEGRYRLDAIDENNRPIAGAPPAYVCIHPSDMAPAPSAPESVPAGRVPAVERGLRSHQSRRRRAPPKIASAVGVLQSFAAKSITRV
jgi:hypothetical protein